MRINIGFCFSISLGLLLLIASVGLGQGICVFPTLKVPAIKGKVLFQKEGVPDATIEIYSSKNPEQIIKQNVTDDQGNFEVLGLENGKYLLTARRQYFSVIKFTIQLTSKNNKNKLLVIRLVPDHEEPCASDGGVTLEPSSTKSENQGRCPFQYYSDRHIYNLSEALIEHTYMRYG
ncbi:MAG: hypothetical protein ACKVQW_14455 [Pyrinomonadaceae bacterium]